MKRIILGTAGHIDHGKTSFVKALTGIDTDRLKEEKERGITIELGFAHLMLPDGSLVGIVDVPGHERFVKNMVAGASGIDLVALIIAADEGVMPQTREHLEICQLLGIRHGIVVITKIDMVDEEWLELVREDTRDYIKGTFLSDAPIVEVSSVTGKGLDNFIHELSRLVQMLSKKDAGHVFRLPVDRVFTVKGFGTVVTGTTISGMIKVGDEVTIYPAGINCKVRTIQVHNQSVLEVGSSTRTALSLQGIDKSEIKRGYVVASRDKLFSTYMLDVSFELLSSAPKKLKSREKVRFHVGTSEIMASIVFLDRDELMPGDSCYAQIRLEEPVSVLKGDRYVVRSYSPIRTIGGGEILHPLAKKKKKRLAEELLPRIELIHKGSPEDMVESLVFIEEYEGISSSRLLFLSNIRDKELKGIIDALKSRKKIVEYDPEQELYIHAHFFGHIRDMVLQLIRDYHKEYPFRPGIPKEELRSKARLIKDVRLFNYLIEQLIKEDVIVSETDNIRLKEYRARLTTEQKRVRDEIERIYKESGFQPPFFKEIKEKYDQVADQMLEYLLSEGSLVKIRDDFYLHKDVLKDLLTKVRMFLEKHGEMSVKHFKEITDTSRKYSIPLLEYLDKTQVTVRVGDIRKLRG